ncbi:MAG TPA: hypothetical protein VIK98_09040, partial [Limnochordales bacterium]
APAPPRHWLDNRVQSSLVGCRASATQPVLPNLLQRKSDPPNPARDTREGAYRWTSATCCCWDSLLVLFTGIFMLMQLGLVGQSKPFWLTFMEQFGGMVALISAGLLTWQLRRFDTAASAEERSRRWRALNRTIAWIAAGIAVTIFVVALRL